MTHHGITVDPIVEGPILLGASIARSVHVNQEHASPQVRLVADLKGKIIFYFVPAFGRAIKLGELHAGGSSLSDPMFMEILPKELHERLDLNDKQVTAVMDTVKFAFASILRDIVEPMLPNIVHDKLQVKPPSGSDPLEQLLSVVTYCDSCHGTGVYHGMFVEKGVGRVCQKCEGTGKKVVPAFTGRKEITGDRRPQQVFWTSWVNPGVKVGTPVSYEDFLAGKMPTGKTIKGR